MASTRGCNPQQLALVAAPGERLELQLPVHLDEQLAQAAQRLHRHRLAVDVGAAATVRGHGAAQQHLAVVLDLLLLQPGQGGRVRGHGEAGRHFGALRAVAHGAAVGPSAHRQQQCIHEDRLAGPGLARQHGESRTELDFDALDDREVANLQVAEHGAGQAIGGWVSRTPRPQCSFERRIR
jgi:hypothetical protein